VGGSAGLLRCATAAALLPRTDSLTGAGHCRGGSSAGASAAAAAVANSLSSAALRRQCGTAQCSHGGLAAQCCGAQRLPHRAGFGPIHSAADTAACC
jgi:hypothetical protein